MTPLCGVIRFSERASKASGAQPFFILYRWHFDSVFFFLNACPVTPNPLAYEQALCLGKKIAGKGKGKGELDQRPVHRLQPPFCVLNTKKNYESRCLRY